MDKTPATAPTSAAVTAVVAAAAAPSSAEDIVRAVKATGAFDRRRREALKVLEDASTVRSPLARALVGSLIF